MTHIESMAGAHQAMEDEAAALDAANELAAAQKRMRLLASLDVGAKLGDAMHPELHDLVSEFIGFNKDRAIVERFMEAAARALFREAKQGNADAVALIDALELYLLENGS